jgi:hypothetical protein
MENGTTTPCGRNSLHSSRARRFRAGINSDFPGRRRNVGLKSGPTIQCFGRSCRIIELRRRGRRQSISVLQTAGGERIDQLRFPTGAPIDSIHIGQMPRPAKRQDDSNQGGDETEPEVVVFCVAQRGIDRWLWHSLEHNHVDESGALSSSARENWRRWMGIEPT